MINFINSQAPVFESDLDYVEKQFHFAFPREFRDLYLKFNGGRPEKNRFLDEKGPCIVHDFLPIKYGKSPLTTMERSIQRLKIEKQILPNYFVQFAIDPGGDYYCFSLREDEFGAIYLFHMDRRDSSRSAEYLAKSLQEFLGKLTTKVS